MVATDRMGAERLTVSIPGALADRMRAAGLSPSAVLKEALEAQLGTKTKKTLDTRVTALERKLAAMGKQLDRVARGEKEI